MRTTFATLCRRYDGPDWDISDLRRALEAELAEYAEVSLLDGAALTLFASDCHNLTYRPPDLDQCFQTIAKKFDLHTAKTLGEVLPAAIIP